MRGDPESYSRLLERIRQALAEELQVEVPPFEVVLHRDRHSFAQGLASRGNEAAFARATALAMDGIGGPGWVELHWPALDALSWDERTAMLAHEVVHVLQYSWTGGRRGASEQWLREGFAEWCTRRVLARLHIGQGTMAEPEPLVRRHLRGMQRPPLTRLRSFQEWLRWVDSRRDALPYLLATTAATRLVERHGAQTLVGYFRRFERSEDRDGIFLDVFDRTIAEFDAEFTEWVERGDPRR